MTVTHFAQDRIGASHAHDPETSSLAAVDNFPRSGNQRHRVLVALAARPNGATFEELQTDTGIESAAKRLTELAKDGWAYKSDRRRPTHTGVKATVYVATVAARVELSRTAGGDGLAPSRDAGPVLDQGTPSARSVEAPPAVHDEPISLFGDEAEPEVEGSTSPYRVFEDAA